jgi:SM-20-related protein
VSHLVVEDQKRTNPDTDPFDLQLVREFFDAPSCRELLNELRLSPSVPAVTYGQGGLGYVDERIRRVARLSPSPKTVEEVRGRLLEYRDQLGEHFGIILNNCEEPQFLRYRVGDFFVAHQDGNTGLLRLESEQSRRISVTIFLNRQSETVERDAYCGGTLVFSDWPAPPDRREFRLSGEIGTLVAFRSETTHEVIPVTYGERYSIVSWYG